MTILHRRCGIAEFADCGKRYDEVLPHHSDPVLRVFRRIFDAKNPIEPDDWKHVVVPTDRLMISALYCDRLGLPPTYAEALAGAVRHGGYAATHALLSWVYVQENGCKLMLPNGFEEEMYRAVARCPGPDVDCGWRPGPATLWRRAPSLDQPVRIDQQANEDQHANEAQPAKEACLRSLAATCQLLPTLE